LLERSHHDDGVGLGMGRQYVHRERAQVVLQPAHGLVGLLFGTEVETAEQAELVARLLDAVALGELAHGLDLPAHPVRPHPREADGHRASSKSVLAVSLFTRRARRRSAARAAAQALDRTESSCQARLVSSRERACERSRLLTRARSRGAPPGA